MHLTHSWQRPAQGGHGVAAGNSSIAQMSMVDHSNVQAGSGYALWMHCTHWQLGFEGFHRSGRIGWQS